MSLIGKTTVINSLMASLFVYKLQVLPVLDTNLVETIEKVIIDFIWKGKKVKIPLTTLQRSKEDGGLGLVNIKVRHEALLCNWVKDAIECEQIRNLAEYHLGRLVREGRIWQLNLNQKDSVCLFNGNSFWHSLIHMWHEYSYHEPQNKIKVLKQNIWYNSLIKTQGKPLLD